ncbi:MAG: hypothetical protein HYT03_00290 [Candidatus Harrisonbacteria bacterium]|nr:hypothetical protein [Candidatus Harrisonbacteria bacterium]
MEHEPKISIVEAFLLFAYVGLVDVAGVILIFFGLDDFFILDVMTFPVTQFYLRLKGVSRAGIDLAMNCAELIPYVGALPLRTVGLAIIVWADRHPESAVAQVAEKAAQATSIKRGKAGMPAPITPGIKTPVGALSVKPAVSFAEAPTGGFKQAA